MSFAHHPEHINRKGRPKGSSKSSLLRSAIQERIDIDKLFRDIEELPPASSIKHRIELLHFVLPRLKPVGTSAMLRPRNNRTKGASQIRLGRC